MAVLTIAVSGIATPARAAAPAVVPWTDAGGVAEPTIRVLVRSGAPQTLIESGSKRFEIVGVAGGLRVNGGETQARWRVGAVEAGTTSKVDGLELRGAIEVLPSPDGARLTVVNEVPLESYLVGTLGREMYGSWSAAALRAQAVASRTYAMHQRLARGGKPWHVRSGTRSQVYSGVAAESDPVRAAVEATRGEVLAVDGAPILAAFHSSSGGRTASAAEVWGKPHPYLVSVPVDDEWDSPDSYWRARVSRTTLARALAGAGYDVGPVRSAEVVERTESGRVARVRFTGDHESATLTGRSLRSALGESTLKSTLFELREAEDGFVFVGSGSGHGVGMSQWGARAMARRGGTYPEILRKFYPGASLEQLAPAGTAVAAASGAR